MAPYPDRLTIRPRSVIRGWLTGALGLASAGLFMAAATHAESFRERYVALGSSYAAGPGTGPLDPNAYPKCHQSIDNYPHLLARKRNLQLLDRSCSGATTDDILRKGQSGQPAQLDAVTADTRLVSITIGGNDVGFMGHLACAAATTCQDQNWPDDASWDRLAANLRQIAVSVHQQAPQARLVFVDYLTVLPGGEGCAALPISTTNLDRLRALATHLAQLTAEVARESNALLLRASALSASHDACSADPWSTGLVPGNGTGVVPFHPNAKGMAEVAAALAQLLNTAGR